MTKLFKRSIHILLSLFLLLSTLSFSSPNVIAESNEVNPYVSLYLKSKTENSLTSNNPVVDPIIEEQIILETLNLYFLLDKQVEDILSNHIYEDDIIQQVTSVNRDDKINVMHKIIDIYDSVSDEESQELLYDFLDRYVRGPEDTDKLTNTFLEKMRKKEPHINVTSQYDGNFAGNWAYYNWNSYRSDYPRFTGDYGSDCTNFVSQAMHIGGKKPKAGNWTISKKNSTYWIIDSVEELNYSWSLTDPSPWISVREFAKYWKPKSGLHSFSKAYYEKTHETIFNYDISKGDVVVFNKGVANFIVMPTHVMIISGYDTSNKDFELAGHSYNRRDLPLLDAIQSYSQIDILQIN